MTKIDFLWLLIDTSQRGRFPACDERHAGKYHLPDGRACPVGLLLIDTYYHPSIEGRGIMDPDVECRILLPEEVSMVQLAEIQSVHDELAFRGWDHPWWVCRVATILTRPR